MMDSETTPNIRPSTEKTEELEKIQRETAAWLSHYPEAGATAIRIIFISICRRNGQLPSKMIAQWLTLPGQDKTRLLTAVGETNP